MLKSMKEEYDFSKGRRWPIEAATPGKTRTTIRVDNEVLKWFRQEVNAMGGGNYQTMIYDVLRDYIIRKKEPVEEIVRRVIREELSNYKS